MKSFSDMQSTAGNLFSAYAQLAAYKMLFRSIINDVIPASVTTYIWSLLSRFFTKPSTEKTTIVVEEHAGGGMSRNVVYESVEMYLGTKASSNTDRFKVSKIPKQKSLFITMEKGQLIKDIFRDEIELKWRFVAVKEENKQHENRLYELSFSKEHREAVVEEYLPFVLKTADEIRNSDKAVKLFSMNGNAWTSVNLDHPTTFEKLAMEPEMKKGLISDLERFVRRKDYYRQVGKAWKRGYLLYGPPGTGKSSLVAAMANYLKFDVYDMELTSLYSDSQLKKIMLTTTNRSIIVIEDIDCSVQTHDRRIPRYKSEPSDTKLTLSGLLNFIDGLWSCCGDERIIIFTTNHKDKLDPALLRPGRMDMHIHLSYCTPAGFRTLAFNYLGIDREHNEILFDEIEGLIESCEVTPAVIAEELMRSEDADAALEGVKTLLTQKLAEKNAAAAAATAEVKDGEKDGEEEEGYDDDDDEEDFENALRMLGPAFRRRFARGWKGSGRGNF